MNRCVIISGSPDFTLPPLRADDTVIACDKGIEYAAAAGIRPDLFVGDMDSTSLVMDGVPRVLSVPEKDDTDTLMAIRRALADGCRDFLLLGCLGGRVDHQQANLAAAGFIAAHGGRCELAGRDVRMFAFADGALTVERRTGWSLSVFSVSDVSTGVCIEGAKYPLHNAVVTNTFPLGVSNEFEAPTARISVEKGILLVMTVRK